MMAILKCKMCGGDIEVAADKQFGACNSCGSTMTFPKLDDEKRANGFNRANHFRRLNDFDKAIGAYELLLNEDNQDAEAHWGVVLSRFGIEYVEDPITHERMPTVHRLQSVSVLIDPDYLSALKYAQDEYIRSLYEQEAQRIAEIQKHILTISANEEPYDVFICYKESTDGGSRTKDSILAQDIFYQLGKEGHRVFFARISLEDKLGQAYEPYIFSALQSAKVMLAIGTKADHFNATWVKNEWSRFLSLMKTDRNKLLIPCYRDMDAYDLPDELSMLQSQDMAKIGFMQDLLRGVGKVLSVGAEPTNMTHSTTSSMGNVPGVESLCKRACLFLEDGDFKQAQDYFDKVLDINPEYAPAYVGLLCAKLGCRSEADLEKNKNALEGHANYQKALRFADTGLKAKLTLQNQAILDRIEKEYLAARAEAEARTERERLAAETRAERERLAAEARAEQVRLASEARAEQGRLAAEALAEQRRKWDAEDAAYRVAKAKKRRIFLSILAVVAATALLMTMVVIPSIRFKNGERLLSKGDYAGALAVFEALGDYRNASENILKVHYTQGEVWFAQGSYTDAVISFGFAIPYKDSAEQVKYLMTQIVRPNANVISAGTAHTVGIKTDGTVVVTGRYESYSAFDHWENIVEVSAGPSHTVGLRADGTVLAVGESSAGRCDVNSWQDIISVSAGFAHTAGLKADGTVVAAGNNLQGQCNTEYIWQNIIAISAGANHTVGLQFDGTVAAVGENLDGRCNVDSWENITAISAGSTHTVGLMANGTVVAVGNNRQGQCDVSNWQDIIAISAGADHTIGLRADGTVVAAGDNNQRRCEVDGWQSIIAISAGSTHTLGLKVDGTIVAVGGNQLGQCDVANWQDIMVSEG